MVSQWSCQSESIAKILQAISYCLSRIGLGRKITMYTNAKGSNNKDYIRRRRNQACRERMSCKSIFK